MLDNIKNRKISTERRHLSISTENTFGADKCLYWLGLWWTVWSLNPHQYCWHLISNPHHQYNIKLWGTEGHLFVFYFASPWLVLSQWSTYLLYTYLPSTTRRWHQKKCIWLWLSLRADNVTRADKIFQPLLSEEDCK